VLHPHRWRPLKRAKFKPLIRRALAIDEQSFGPDHPKVAIRLKNLAQLLQATNRLAEAEPLMRRAVVVFFAALGTEHPSSRTVAGNYGQILGAMGRTEEEIKEVLASLVPRS
jgi:hypothetical protein